MDNYATNPATWPDGAAMSKASAQKPRFLALVGDLATSGFLCLFPENVPDHREREVSMTRRTGPIDVHLGLKLKLRRDELGLSQREIAEAIHLTYQQVQKYEKGTNRISAVKLWKLSNVLNVPMTYFFEVDI